MGIKKVKNLRMPENNESYLGMSSALQQGGTHVSTLSSRAPGMYGVEGKQSF
eukprot:CAMPEP_0177395024 /NCGR_PEP_ID=MMETSP0368-20130122/55895_1 /TAXON_ID=447022 ORGANISM="Scrippsiella hangoei-like, Strain SHHI-4" /NCGR_SAMPLE_ID=MMETSP0368 /ASSEMBLY_ACC=CAM_ASM_000363 /LENGTH=51 /DNA_ID=CAMNT_0018861509 /DNA_START=86 /DNA_END=241 /DNA_ORIENTATION=+